LPEKILPASQTLQTLKKALTPAGFIAEVVTGDLYEF
jgi:hypothetical protein